ncbi:MAG: hypothetical protein KJ879_01650, partial [Nanoarchaeota archaeon]|nr:hypothetical protein [Nanoarchaeota archaeon]
SLFYDSPEYTDFCDEFKTTQVIENQAQCEAVDGQWALQEIRCITEPCPQGYCDRDFVCRQEYEGANEIYSRNIFFITLPLGIAVIALGALVFGLEAVGAGLMAGGVGVFLWGIMRFWNFANDWLKFILLLVGLVAVIWLAYYFNDRFGKKPSRKKR